MKNIAVLILNWQTWSDTVNAVDSLSSLEGVTPKIFVMDNHSPNDSWEQLNKSIDPSKYPFPIELIQSNKNLGFADGMNQLIRYTLKARPDYFYLLNSDATVFKDTITNAVDFAEKYDAPLLNSLSIDAHSKKPYFWGARQPWHMFGNRKPYSKDECKKAWPTDYCEGAGLLIRRDLVETSLSQRGFVLDPSFFLYCEDTDLGFFARSLGYSGWVVENSNIEHKISGSSGGKANPIVLYYITRNRIFLANTWLPLWQKVLFHCYYLPSRFILIARRALLRDFKTIPNYLRGLMDGYLGRRGFNGKVQGLFNSNW